MVQQRLDEIIRTTVEGLAYELVGWELLPRDASSLLRIYLDKPSGITLEDCEIVSNQLSAVLDVEDVIKSQYVLEVSSPGLDRPLFTLEHYKRFLGEKVKLKTRRAIDGRKHYKGILVGVEDNHVVIQDDTDEKFTIDFQIIEKGRLETS